MDKGPFRGQRPVERIVSSRPQPVARQAEAPQTMQDAPMMQHVPTQGRAENKENRMKRFMVPIIIVLVVLLVAVGWFVWRGFPSSGAGINSKEYQAVFLSNGQVYFGKLTAYNGGYMKMTDIFYLQAQNTDTSAKDSGNPQNASNNAQSNVQLIKLGGEIHGPEDEMFIAKDQVLFYENLKPSGKVSQTIKQSQQ